MGYSDIVIVPYTYAGGGLTQGRTISDSRITANHIMLNDSANMARDISWTTSSGSLTISFEWTTDAMSETFVLGIPES